VKPQRSQRKTLCPQKDLPIKEISERQGACRKSAREEVIIEQKAARKGMGRGLEINLFSVSSVVGF
jgi:hypothetical protein